MKFNLQPLNSCGIKVTEANHILIQWYKRFSGLHKILKSQVLISLYVDLSSFNLMIS